MRVVAAAALLGAATILAGGARAETGKSHFAATTPGSWALQELVAPGVAPSRYTYTRLADQDGKVQLEIKVEFLAGAGAGTSSTSRYLLGKDFDLARDGLSYLRFVESYAFVGPDGAVTALPAETAAAIRESASDFRGGLTLRDRQEIEGHACDHFAYRAPSGGAAPTLSEGEVWLDASVPFAIVRQTGTVKDKAGKVQSSFTVRLIDSGAGSASAAPAQARAATAEATPIPGPLTLAKAYGGEKVRLRVEVAAGSLGKKLLVTLENKTDEALRVVIPKGKTVLPAGTPLETLVVVSPGEQVVEVPAGGRAEPAELTQAAARGVVEGKFDLSMYEGTPLFSGSVTMDSLDKK
jgi:hypothetical protein